MFFSTVMEFCSFIFMHFITNVGNTVSWLFHLHHSMPNSEQLASAAATSPSVHPYAMYILNLREAISKLAFLLPY